MTGLRRIYLDFDLMGETTIRDDPGGALVLYEDAEREVQRLRGLLAALCDAVADADARTFLGTLVLVPRARWDALLAAAVAACAERGA